MPVAAAQKSRATGLPALLIIAAGCLMATITFGPRATMGFYLTPMTTEYGWGREAFAAAIAIQNLVWGVTQPFTGMIADRFGTARVLTAGAFIYATGLIAMAHTTDALMFQLVAGVLMGIGIAASTFALVLAAFARLLPDSMRSLAFGFGTAASSAGQFIFAPLGQAFIENYGWQNSLMLMAAFLMIIPALSYMVRGRPDASGFGGQLDQTIPQALREAFNHPSYRWLIAGFFVCGFQLGFVTVHLPPYLDDVGIDARWAAYALGTIGLFNIIGSITSGYLSGRYQKRLVLSWIYFVRALIIAWFVLTPPSVTTLMIFSALIGFTWLSTVPPTQGLVHVMFGTRYMATLFGFVFFSHQFGQFLAIWLGGYLYDRTGSYDIIWWSSVVLGFYAAIVHLPIKEKPVERPAIA